MPRQKQEIVTVRVEIGKYAIHPLTKLDNGLIQIYYPYYGKKITKGILERVLASDLEIINKNAIKPRYRDENTDNGVLDVTTLRNIYRLKPMRKMEVRKNNRISSFDLFIYNYIDPAIQDATIIGDMLRLERLREIRSFYFSLKNSNCYWSYAKAFNYWKTFPEANRHDRDFYFDLAPGFDFSLTTPLAGFALSDFVFWLFCFTPLFTWLLHQILLLYVIAGCSLLFFALSLFAILLFFMVLSPSLCSLIYALDFFRENSPIFWNFSKSENNLTYKISIPTLLLIFIATTFTPWLYECRAYYIFYTVFCFVTFSQYIFFFYSYAKKQF